MTVGRSSRLPPFKQGRLVLLATLLLVIVMAAVAAVAYLRLQEDGKGGPISWQGRRRAALKMRRLRPICGQLHRNPAAATVIAI